MRTGTLKMLNVMLGYPDTLSYDDYYQAFRRIGICKRIIKANVDFTWRTHPIIKQDKNRGKANIQSEIEQLDKRLKLFNVLKRADTLACIGQYSILVIGTKDGEKLDTPLKKGNGIEDIAFLTAYSEKQAAVNTWDTNTNSPRYGLPETYRINVQGQGLTTVSHLIHHSRVIHIADDTIDNEIYGTPKLEAPFNYIHDLYKTVGSSAEMFWLGAYQGLVFSVDGEKTLNVTPEALDEMDKNIEEYYNKARRNLKLYGTEVHSLPSITPNPSGIVDVLLQLISAASGIPTRILLGSEQGQLASSTDRDMFLSMIAGRRENFADGVVLEPLINRLIEHGYIQSQGDYEIEWTPLIERDAGERLLDAQRMVQTARQAVGPTGEIGEVIRLEEIREAMGLDKELPDLKDRAAINGGDCH